MDASAPFVQIIGVLAAAMVMLLMFACIYAAWLRHGSPRDDFDDGEGEA